MGGRKRGGKKKKRRVLKLHAQVNCTSNHELSSQTSRLTECQWPRAEIASGPLYLIVLTPPWQIKSLLMTLKTFPVLLPPASSICHSQKEIAERVMCVQKLSMSLVQQLHIALSKCVRNIAYKQEELRLTKIMIQFKE